MRKFFIFYLLTLYVTFLVAQENPYSLYNTLPPNTTVKFDTYIIQETRPHYIYDDGWRGQLFGKWSSFNYRGVLADGVMHFFHIDPLRVKTKGFNSLWGANISIYSADSKDFSEEYDVMCNRFKRMGITISDINDTLEVWTMVVSDPNRLKLYECRQEDIPDFYSSGWFDKEKTPIYKQEYADLEFFRDFIQKYFEKIVYLDFKSSSLYGFEIPGEIIQSKSFEVLRDYLKKVFRIELSREKRLEKMKLINFDRKE